MGRDPATSVANPWGELHDTPGVWIGDASAFPTRLGNEPDGDDHGAGPPDRPSDSRRLDEGCHGPTRFRTPDERFEGLPGFPWEPHYREVDGLRLAHLDEGEGRPVVLLPWRADLVVSVAQGDAAGARRRLSLHRPRLRRLRPLRQADRHRLVLATTATRSMATALVDELDLRDAVAVVHDWGGPIGLRLAVEHPDRFSAMVIMDTGLFTGEQPMSDAWKIFRDFVERTEDLPISMLVSGAAARGMDDEVVAAYDAPFPRRSPRPARAPSR